MLIMFAVAVAGEMTLAAAFENVMRNRTPIMDQHAPSNAPQQTNARA
jgi:hypothetical protein